MSSSPSSYLALLGLAPMWLVAMGWHLWRIATGRPAFPQMSDTRATTASFVAVFFGAGLVRWSVAGGRDLVSTVIGLVLMAFAVVLIAERPHRSSSLTASILGASAAVDILVIGGHLIWSMPLRHTAYSFLELMLIALCAVRFSQAQEHVRRAGYRRQESSSSQD